MKFTTKSNQLETLMLPRLSAFLMLLATFVPSTASAHYLWVKLDQNDASRATANIFFEESASAGDGHYLDPFLKSKTTWIRTIENIQPVELPLTEKRIGDDKRWVTVGLPSASPRSIDSYWLFGVYQYGKRSVLLHYYARHLDVDRHEDLHELGRAEQMALDIVPHDFADKVELRVIWNGDPVPDTLVHIRGPKGFKKNIKTNTRGIVRFTIDTAGEYSFRSSVEEQKTGRHGDEDYEAIRHNATLIMALPLSE